MIANGKPTTACGLAVQHQMPVMLHVALTALRREGLVFAELPRCQGEPCSWAREVAECLLHGDCRSAVLFCDDGSLACCVANKLPGIRAAAADSVPQAERAIITLGANLLIVELADRTFFEFKHVLRLVASAKTACPPGVACVLGELEKNHAHR